MKTVVILELPEYEELVTASEKLQQVYDDLERLKDEPQKLKEYIEDLLY